MSKDVTFDKLLLEASQYLFQNDLINARAKINKALSRKPNEPKALALLATILSSLDDRAGAVAIYRVLLNNFPDEPALHFKLGCEYLMLGDFILGVKEIKTAIKMNPENEEWRIFSSGMQKLLNGKENLDIEPDQLSGELREILEYIYDIKDRVILDSSSRKTKLDSHKKIKLVREDGIDDLDQEKLQADFQQLSNKKDQGKTEAQSSQAESSPKNKKSTPEKRLPSSSIFVQNQNPPVATSKEDPEELKNFFIQKNDVETQISLRNFEEIFYSRDYILLPHNQKYYFREKLFLCSLMEFKYFQAFQRFRGHRTDTPIIDSKTGKLLRCTNGGNIALKPLDDHIFFAIKVDHQPLYIVENHIAAFHGDLKWENGWLRSENKKIAMMSFRGEGTVFIQIKQSIFNIELPPEDFVLIPVTKLLGWQGNIVAQCQSSSFVHAAGDGCVFIS